MITSYIIVSSKTRNEYSYPTREAAIIALNKFIKSGILGSYKLWAEYEGKAGVRKLLKSYTINSMSLVAV